MVHCGSNFGSLAGLVLTWERSGFGWLRNLGLRLVGALIGGVFFLLFELFPAFDRMTISLRDVVGALVVPLVFWHLRLGGVSGAHANEFSQLRRH